MKANEYQCASCGGVFEYGWPDESATTELANNFPGFDKTECAVICDDCYQQTGLFCGPPQDPYREIPKYMREAYRAHMDRVAAKVAKAIEDQIFYGTGLLKLDGL